MTPPSASRPISIETTNGGSLASASSGERAIYTQPAARLVPDTVISGKYRLHGELGRGGFAVVYDAEHIGLQRAVALKVLHRSAGTPSILLERFAREVRISALVRHAHVLQVYDVGMLADGSPFLVMEKIQGETLHHYLCLLGRLSVEQTIELSSQLLSALVALAARDIVHRDIKPENLMLTSTESGELLLKLVDFGIALVRREQIATTRLTRHGSLVGTPHYMAPEQLRSGAVDARIDVYATGVVMYQALTGHLPFDGEDLGSLTLNVLHGNARSIRSLRPECPARLASIVERALAREPERRFANAASMLAALNDVASEQRFAKLGWYALRPSVLRGTSRGRASRVSLAVVALAGSLLVRPWFSGSSPVEPSAHLTRPAGSTEAGLITLTQLGFEPPAPHVLQLVDDGRAAAPPAAAGRSQAPSSRAVDQERAAALLRRALASYLHGEIEAAYSAYRRSSQRDPSEPSAFRGLALSASRLGKVHEAQRAYARYLELSPRATDVELVKARVAELSVLAVSQRVLRASGENLRRAP
jgi:serine/threonine protein kinase